MGNNWRKDSLVVWYCPTSSSNPHLCHLQFSWEEEEVNSLMQKRLLVGGEEREGCVLPQERDGDQLLLHISSVHHCLLLVSG